MIPYPIMYLWNFCNSSVVCYLYIKYVCLESGLPNVFRQLPLAIDGNYIISIDVSHE
jgi:hypothetical protein